MSILVDTTWRNLSQYKSLKKIAYNFCFHIDNSIANKTVFVLPLISLSILLNEILQRASVEQL